MQVRLLLLAAVSGEHMLLIGPPGTAKSEVGRRLHKLVNGTYFERLLTRFSVPEVGAVLYYTYIQEHSLLPFSESLFTHQELFGPLSMRALEQDKYERHTSGYLPEAEIAFIDEIFKVKCVSGFVLQRYGIHVLTPMFTSRHSQANSAILNTLLSLINERLFDNGSQRMPAPLITMVERGVTQ